MKKLKLKSYVIPTFMIVLGFVSILTAILSTKPTNSLEEDNTKYVSDTIVSEEQAVINEEKRIIYPYTDQTVKIGKNYYDYKGESKDQENSIIFHENTYIQNTGIDFIGDNEFDVISVLEGTVTNVKEDKSLGKIVEINHNNEYVSIYQSINNVKVSKGDNIAQGQLIGTSGTNELDKNLGNHLHFELYANGQIVNPLNYFDKVVSTLNGE